MGTHQVGTLKGGLYRLYTALLPLYGPRISLISRGTYMVTTQLGVIEIPLNPLPLRITRDNLDPIPEIYIGCPGRPKPTTAKGSV